MNKSLKIPFQILCQTANFYSLVCVVFLTLLPAAASGQYLACGASEDFELGPVFWSATDNAGNGVIWGRLEDCGASNVNLTGGSGNALCVNRDTGGAGLPFDTTAEFNSFNLNGATSATLRYEIIFDHSGVGSEALDVEIGAGSPTVWTPVKHYIGDVIGISDSVSLNAYLGSSSVYIRFRYYDSGLLLGNYAQIDDVIIDCTGGADVAASLVPDVTSAFPGDPVNYTLTVTNNGGIPATQLAANFQVPLGFQFFSSTASYPGTFDYHSGMFNFSLTSPLAALDSFSINIKTAAGFEPKATLQINSPGAIAGTNPVVGAVFGPALNPNTPITADLVLADDGNGATDDACESLINGAAVNSRIALIAEGNCEADVKVKNAQDAGAAAAIVRRKPVTVSGLEYLGDVITALNAFDPVTSNIIVPSAKIGATLGTTLINALGSGTVNVSLYGRTETSQQQKATSIGIADEMDPNLNLGPFLTGGDISGVNNISQPLVTVLLDSDQDGSADINDGCPTDPGKTAAGACGCGKADTDANGNGTVDCLYSAELKTMLADGRKLLKKIKRLKTTGNPKKDKKRRKKQKKIKKDLKTTLAAIYNLTKNNGSGIAVKSPKTNLTKLAKKLKNKGKKALKTGSPLFEQNKKKAARAFKKMQKALV